MKKLEPKKPRAINIEPEVKKRPSKPKKTGLSKSDPDYYRKIGLRSAKKRKISSEQFAEWARKSHLNRTKESYQAAGRPKKNVADE